MNLRRSLVVLFLVATLALVQNAAAATDTPATVTKALFQKQMKGDGYTPETVKADREWLTPDLYAKLSKQVNSKKQKGEDPDIDCDPILNAQDVPEKLEIGKTTTEKSNAKVEVILTWGKDKAHFTVSLKQIEGAWKVDDIDYGKDGSLRKLLK